MKKIITLSVVCLVSGQLFAQTNDTKAQAADVQTKLQIEKQSQKAASVMSLPQAAASLKPATGKAAVATTLATPVSNQTVVATPATKAYATAAAKTAIKPVASNTNAAADAKLAQPSAEAISATPVVLPVKEN